VTVAANIVKEKVYIGSSNPVKIECVRQAFDMVFGSGKFDFIGQQTESGVPDQPRGDKETLQGAENRAAAVTQRNHDGMFWVGVEGGILVDDDQMEAFAWIVVMTREKTGKARTATFMLPGKVTSLVQQGIELGEADDIVFNRKNSKQQNGIVGQLTKGLIDRVEYYKHAVILALVPFMHKELF
jgi:inosine/xanthosine triphosphatase